MILAFVSLRVTDVVDILLVAYILYKLYGLVRNTPAFNIFVAIFVMFLCWLVVRAMKMDLMSNILKQVFSVGLIALVILFQPEIRRFLSRFGGEGLIPSVLSPKTRMAQAEVNAITEACRQMSEVRRGALIVLARTISLQPYVESGDRIDAVILPRLIESIFFKNSPMHDGAMIIGQHRIIAARCVLPLSENPEIPANLGLRHRAALGITEETDACAVVVSEETGEISFAENGKLHENVSPEDLNRLISASL